MKLKKLSLQGYKTFASKTEFVFDDGITAVVGPNGSGKSNIADALRWVLGEQSYGTLRGKRTTDMIFAGSQTRARAGMAQAILTLDNSDGWLPIDYAEVEIGRRAHRSGENEYLLNGQKVRLKDITDLLATSGLAERTYTIIGQGLVDRALSLRADERRALFEEAAGIMHYKTRRAETLRRLNETEHNLERVRDILAEIRPRLASLRRQATRARNYEQVQQDLRQLLRIWYGFKWDQSRQELRKAREAALTSEKEWQRSRQALLVQQQNLDDLQSQINRTQQRIGELQGEREQMREQWEAARREAAVLLERRAALARQVADIDHEQPAVESQLAQARADLASATDDLAAAQGQLDQHRSQLQTFNETFEDQQRQIAHWQTAVATSEQERAAAQHQLAQAEGRLSQLRERLAEQSSPTAVDGDDLAALAKQIERQTAVLSAAQKGVASLRSERLTLQQRRQELISSLKQQRRAARDQESALNRDRGGVARQETRVDMLDQLRTKEVQFSEDVQLLGPLAGLIDIPEAHQTAVEAALSARLATLVVSDRNSLWSIVDGPHEQSLTVAALADIQPPQMPSVPTLSGVIGWAADKVSSREGAAAVARLLLGPVLLVENRRTAYALASQLPPGSLAVTPDGLVVHAGGLVQTRGQGQTEGILSREKAWREAQAALAATRSDLAAAEAEAAALQEAIQRDQEQVDAWQNEERRLSSLENESLQRQSAAQRELDRIRQQLAYQEKQQERQAEEHGRLQARIETFEAQINIARTTLAAQESALTEARGRLEGLPVAESQQQQAALSQQIASAGTIVAGRQAVVDSRRTTLNQLQSQLERLRVRKEALTAEIAGLSKEETAEKQEQMQDRLTAVEASLQPQQTRLAEIRNELKTLQQKSAGLQRAAHEQETLYTQTQVRLTQRENQIESLQERIHNDLGLVALRFDADQAGATPLPIEEIVDQLPQVDELPPEIEDNIHQYRGQLQRMGGINPDAPQEFEETEARYEFMTQQVEDLEQTEEQLRAVIAELDELTSAAFADTVEQVNAVFGETFTQLFGGGSARLVLTDPDDLTISGVDIVARLPNRREQGLGLLSGGERSLTASALIFSLLKVSPTPFCVMDEVDAALDEANINRFRDILRELSLKTQFIIITHNRGTVQAAQTLYGVSMQPDSASQVISIRPEEYTQKELV
jgi:chromosome segregation protein